MRIRSFVCGACCCLLFLNCQDKGVDGPPASSVRIFPNSGLIGSVVKIQGSGFYSDGTWVRFSGASTSWLCTTHLDTITAVVPFDALTGPITVLTESGEQQTSTFEVAETYEPNKLTAKWWNLSPPDPWLDSCAYGFTGIVTCWERSSSGDTVTLTLPEFYIPSGGYLTQILKFRDQGNGNLPQVISMIVENTSGSGTRIDTLQRGLIKIIQWNTSGRIQGQVFPPHWVLSPYVFTFFENG